MRTDLRNLKRKGTTSGRDPGGFVALPWLVLDSEGYANISPLATRLLLDLARQYVKDNNGSLILTMNYLKTRGWKSADLVTKAKKELIANGLIYETVKGGRPNKASWYAMTWYALDKSNKYDYDLESGFRRGAYRSPPNSKNATLSPPSGVSGSSTAPIGGANGASLTPLGGAIAAKTELAHAPSTGIHLEIPSPAEAKGRRVRIMSSGDSRADPAQIIGQRVRTKLLKTDE